MYIKDYDFVTKNIDALFDKEIVIYGAKAMGKTLARLLEDAHVVVDCFCDRDSGIGCNLGGGGYPVITLAELKSKTKKADCMIIVASKRYREEMIDELQKNEINGYVCTWYGLRLGIELNIADKRFPEEFRRDIRRKIDLYDDLKKVSNYQCRSFESLYGYLDGILVYQPGKVGSTTIYRTLLRENMQAFHIHHIVKNLCRGTGIEKVIDGQIDYFRKKLMGDERRKLKIITLVRDPVARALANFMQEYYEDLFLVSVVTVNHDLQENAQKYVMKNCNYEFIWFDEELKALTGVDIFDYPFDKEKGYAWIKKDDVEILVLKMEKMDENEKIVGEFVGKSELKYVNHNIGDNKYSKNIYQELKKRFSISLDRLKEYYDNERFLHFYTEEEKMELCNRWGKNFLEKGMSG